MKTPKKKDREVMHALMGQVASVVKGNAKSERDVVTLISRPMWRKWCADVGEPEDSVPGEWGKSVRVYGSETIIVESEHDFAVSFLP